MYTQQAEAIERERKRIVCVWYWFPNLLSWLSFYSGSNLIGLSFVGYPNWIEPSNIHICHPGEEMLKKEIKLSYDLYLKVIFILKVVFSALELSMSLFISFNDSLNKINLSYRLQHTLCWFAGIGGLLLLQYLSIWCSRSVIHYIHYSLYMWSFITFPLRIF